ERGRFRPDMNAGHDVASVDFERVAFEAERQRQRVENLQWVHPRFGVTVLVAEERGAAADDIEEGAGAGGPLQLRPVGAKREPRNTFEWGRRLRCQADQTAEIGRHLESTSRSDHGDAIMDRPLTVFSL